MTRFSGRLGAFGDETAADLHPLEEETRRLRAAGVDFFDLAETNPTRVGLASTAGVVAALKAVDPARYAPAALGSEDARAAVAAWLGPPHRAHHSFLSASTSEAYTWLFKLVADPGDEILVPSPSYPLFGHLAELEGVSVRRFSLALDHGFAIDRDALLDALGPRTRAIVCVNPNNPTGHYVSVDDYAFLDEVAAERDVALIVDEVFADHAPTPVRSSKVPRAARFVRPDGSPRRALTFVMGGLSKSLAAPQLKLAWTHLFGPDAAVFAAIERIEWIADTFLSVATPIQLALPSILAQEPLVRAEVLGRLGANLVALDRLAAPLSSVTRVSYEGGWTALLRVPRLLSDDELARQLIVDAGVRVLPGSFFGFAREGYLAPSLLVAPDVFAAGTAALVAHLARMGVD